MIRRRQILLGVSAVVLAVLIALTVRKMHELACRKRLIQSGFPDSYAAWLAPLQAAHENWRFVPLAVSDLSWNQIVDKECTASWNLVPYSTWAPAEWQKYGVDNYKPYYAEKAKAYDSGSWYQASRAAVAYFLDPRNFMNESDVFMFEALDFDEAAQPRSTVEGALRNSFMHEANCDGGDRKFSELIVDVGRKLGVSPVFLAGRLTSEQGNGTVQGLGKIGDSLFELCARESDKVGNQVIWGRTFTRKGRKTEEVLAAGRERYNGYYNLFNIGAYGTGVFEIRYNAWREAVAPETCAKYLGPWNTQARAIEGGAMKIRELYISTCRHTRYLQKFSVLPQAGNFRWKQYMQNIAAPLSEARNTRKAYDAVGALNRPYRFLIPVYVGMPSEPSPDPAKGRSVYSPSAD